MDPQLSNAFVPIVVKSVSISEIVQIMEPVDLHRDLFHFSNRTVIYSNGVGQIVNTFVHVWHVKVYISSLFCKNI